MAEKKATTVSNAVNSTLKGGGENEPDKLFGSTNSTIEYRMKKRNNTNGRKESVRENELKAGTNCSGKSAKLKRLQKTKVESPKQCPQGDGRGPLCPICTH